jgi:hypothetical protein
MMNMPRALIESPFMFRHECENMRIIGQLRNVTYARLAARDCLLRGYAPYGSHLFFPQPLILDDDISEERELGIYAGLEWGKAAEVSLFYVDLGESTGMRIGRKSAIDYGRSCLPDIRLSGWEQAISEDPSETLVRLGLYTSEALDFLILNKEMINAFGLTPMDHGYEVSAGLTK